MQTVGTLLYSVFGGTSDSRLLTDNTGDIFTVQEMLGHKNVATTQKYLSVNYASVRQAIEEIAVSGELHESNFLFDIFRQKVVSFK